MKFDPPRYNGGVECDNDDGPCACGAWHSPAETWPKWKVDVAANLGLLPPKPRPRLVLIKSDAGPT